MANDTTTKFRVDISELKKNFQEATRQIRLANSEFKAATSGLDKWSESADGVSAKLSQLDKVLAAQKKQLESLESQYKLVAKQEGESSKGAQELLIKINNQKAAIGNTEKQIRTYTSKLEEMQSATEEVADEQEEAATAFDKLKRSISDQEAELEQLKSKYANVVLEQGKNSDAAQDLASQIDSLSGELKENKSKLNEAEEAADEFDRSLEDLDDEANNTTNGGLSAFGVALGNLIANIVMDAINKLKDLAAETINVGKQFDASMSNVAALSGASVEDLEMLRDTAKEYGSTTKFSASEAADALGYMALAGWDAQQSADGLGGVLDLAAASNMDLAQASDMVTDYLSAFSLEAKDSARFADLLAYAQANSNTTTQALGEAFKSCAANMNAAGQDVETTTALLSMMANQGLKGSEAGTALTAVMRDMTAKMKDGAIQIGDTSVQVMDANGNYRDMTDILLDVEAATQGMGDAERATALQTTFTSDSIKGLNLMLNAGVENAADFEEQLRGSGGSAKEMAEIMQNNLGGDLTSLSSKFEGVQIAIYEKFEPALRKGVEALSKLLDVFSWLIDNGAEVAAVITGVATAVGTFLLIVKKQAILTAFIGLITKIKTAFMGLFAVMAANPIALVIAAIAGLVAAFVVLWNKSEKFRNFWIGLWEKIKTVTSIAWTAISGFFTAAWTKVQEIWGGIAEFFSGLWESIKSIFSTIAEWISTNVFQPIIQFFQPVIDFFTTAWNIISELAKGCWELIKLVWEGVSLWFDETIVQPVSQFFSGLWNGIKDAASTAWEGIKETWNVVSSWFNDTIVEPVSTFFSSMWSGIKSAASDAWEGIKSVFKPVADWFEEKFSKAWQKVKDVFSTGGKIFDGIKDGIVDAFKFVVNAIIRGINKVIAIPFNAINNTLDKIRDISIAGVEPFSGLISRFDVPQIPELAQGGVLRKGQVGYLEGDGDEAVVPLEKNTEWIDKLATKIAEKTGSSVTYNFNQTNNSPKALSRWEIYRQTRNLINAVKGV